MSNWMTDQDNLNKLNVSGHQVPEDIFQWLKDVSLDAKKNGKDSVVVNSLVNYQKNMK